MKLTVVFVHGFNSSATLFKATVHHALLACIFLVGGCSMAPESTVVMGGVHGRWAPLLEQIRDFERCMGFVPTRNFASLSTSQISFPFCGHASSLTLPYSYEDPVIRWYGQQSEQQCRKSDPDTDVYYGESEAVGESGSPVTTAMVDGYLDRFIYLVIHEDCHDQYDLPHGIEEPLCNVIAFKAMTEFARAKYGRNSTEYREIVSYAESQARVTRAAVSHYQRLASLHARYERKEIARQDLLRDRVPILRAAANALRRSETMNNVSLASQMTYSRHFAFMERLYEDMGDDLAKYVEFFRHVDRAKPSKAAVLKQLAVASERTTEFVRGHETAIIDTVRRLLPRIANDASR